MHMYVPWPRLHEGGSGVYTTAQRGRFEAIECNKLSRNGKYSPAGWALFWGVILQANPPPTYDR